MASDRQVRIGQISVSTTPSVSAPRVRIGGISVSTTSTATLVDLWSTLSGLGKYQLYVWRAAQSQLVPVPLQQWSASLNQLVPVLSNSNPTPVPTAANQNQIGVIGDSLTAMGTSGPALITTVLESRGWLAANIEVTGVSGMRIFDDTGGSAGNYISSLGSINGTSAVGKGTTDIITAYRTAGFDPRVWLIALGTNNELSGSGGPTTQAPQIQDVINQIMAGPAGNYIIYWMELGYGPGSDRATYVAGFTTTLGTFTSASFVTSSSYTDYLAAVLGNVGATTYQTYWDPTDTEDIHNTVLGYQVVRAPFYGLTVAAEAPSISPTPTGTPPSRAPFTGSGSLSIVGKASFGVGTGGGSTTPLPAEGSPQAALNALTGQWTPTRGLWTCSNFSQGTPPYAYGFYVPAAKSYGINGPGTRADLVLEMVAHSSTMASYVPAQSTGQTNQLYLLRIGGNGGPTTNIQDFTLNGTPQGHNYNGLWLYYAANSTASDILVTGIPGGPADSQPNETFGFATFNSPNCTITNVEVDGRDWSSGSAGAAVAASNFGINDSSGAALNGCYSHDNAYAHGFAFYVNQNLTLTSLVAENINKNGYNFEQTTGTVTMTSPTALNCAEAHMSVISSLGSAVINIHDPVFDGPKWRAKCTPGAIYPATGKPSLQLQTDIHLFIGGVERPDLLSFT